MTVIPTQQYDEVVADNGRLLNEMQRQETRIRRLEARLRIATDTLTVLDNQTGSDWSLAEVKRYAADALRLIDRM
jgi:hypothetical protein